MILYRYTREELIDRLATNAVEVLPLDIIDKLLVDFLKGKGKSWADCTDKEIIRDYKLAFEGIRNLSDPEEVRL